MQVAQNRTILEQAKYEVLVEQRAEAIEELKDLYRQKLQAEMVVKNIDDKIAMLEAKVQEEEDALSK